LEVRIENLAAAQEAIGKNDCEISGVPDKARTEVVYDAEASCPACGALAGPGDAHCSECGIKLL
jgi:hypothetical protein